MQSYIMLILHLLVDRFLLGIVFLFFLVSCSNEMKMNQDILAFHIYSQTSIDLDAENKENVELLSKSFGMEESEVKDIQKYILSKKSGSALRWSFRSVLEDKVKELLEKTGKNSSEDFIINVLAPYLNLLARNELQSVGLETHEFQNKICSLYAKFFPEKFMNSLDIFIGDVRFYFEGGTSSVKHLHALNENLVKYGYYVDFEMLGSSNILKVQDELLPETRYKRSSIKILNLKRFIPGLLPPKGGYYAIGSNIVIVLEDMMLHEAEELSAELKEKYFKKYTDRRFEKFWRAIGPDLNLTKANQIYNELVRRDFENKNFPYIKAVCQMGVAVHEAKHLADNIEHPELTLNIDREFSAHVTQTIYSPATYVTLFSAINRMQNYAMLNRVSELSQATRSLWELAIRSYDDQFYAKENLRSDLLQIYENYRTIREHASFESLDVFEQTVVRGVNQFYQR